MEELKVYVKANLKTSSGKKVPNGKMAAQSAHAVMGVFLSLFEKKEDHLLLLEENRDLFNAFKNKTLKIDFLPYKEEVEYAENVIAIVDQGRTVFKEPTLTAVAVAPKGYTYRKTTDCQSESGERYGAKQAIVINKELIKDKWEMFSLVSEASLAFLIDTSLEMGGEVIIPLKNEGVKAWINGAFAKITLQPKEKTMIELMVDLNSSKTLLSAIVEKDGNPVCVSVGPDFVEKVDACTKVGYRLA